MSTELFFDVFILAYLNQARGGCNFTYSVVGFKEIAVS
jgi:hypothetical protein